MEMFILLIYTLILVMIAYKYRHVSSLNDFLVANKSCGKWTIVFAERSTGESGWLTLGLTGMGFAIGLQGLWIVLGEIFFLAISWLIIAPRFKKIADKYDSLTVFDFFESVIGDNIGIIRIVSMIIIFSLVPVYLAAQYAAIGKSLNLFIDISKTQSMLIGFVALTVYVSIGGFRAMSMADIFHGSVLLLGLTLMIVVCITTIGFRDIVFTEVLIEHPNFFNVFGNDGFSYTGIITAISYFAIGLGFLGVPHLYVIFLAAKNDQTIKKGALPAILIGLIFDSFALSIGILGRCIIPDLADSETIFPMLVKSIFSPVIIGFFMIVVIAAILSTADSLLLLVSSSIVRDVCQKLLYKGGDEKKLVMVAKILVVLFSFVAIGFAYGDSRLIFWLVLFAWAAIGAAFNPLLIYLVLGKQVGKYTAVTAIVLGCLTTIVWSLLLAKETGVYEMIPGFIVGFLCLMIGGWLECKNENIS